ncbi:MAG: hypothetical protein V2I51_11675 [Anderseniella sp.]|nr:hypothetical protein [Anderseniella sp.]
MSAIWLLPILWLGVVGGVLLYYRRDLVAVWREPVLRYPVMIIESDDWGAGPVESQAAAFNQLVDVLTRYRDRDGRHPVMTLALVLAVPDGPAIRRDGRYHRIALDDPRYAPVRAAIERGRRAGVFALQLHGLEHYWPANLMSVNESSVSDWLVAEQPQATEKLPSHLQSRWVDATALPSRPLEREAVASAVAEEVRLFERVFGDKPRVAVPPTFVWTAEVERAWAGEGVEFVVTPGLRSACRNASGLPDCDSGPFRNGEPGEGVTYLVRDDYFEPERGHRAERALQALAEKTEQGRPCLLETHRSNFIGDESVAGNALAEIGRLYDQALVGYPDLRFISVEELGIAIRKNDPGWIEQRPLRCLNVWRARVQNIAGFWRLARLTGLAWLMGMRPASVRRV